MIYSFLVIVVLVICYLVETVNSKRTLTLVLILVLLSITLSYTILVSTISHYCTEYKKVEDIVAYKKGSILFEDQEGVLHVLAVDPSRLVEKETPVCTQTAKRDVAWIRPHEVYRILIDSSDM